MNEKKKNYYSGILMLIIGIATTTGSLEHKLGTLSRMGPGYFPLILGVALIVVAAIILITAFMQADTSILSELEEELALSEDKPKVLSLRAPLCVVVGAVLFIIFGQYGGLMLATFAVVFMSALGDTDNSIKTSFLAAAAITAFAVLVFHFGLRMQFPLFSWG